MAFQNLRDNSAARVAGPGRIRLRLCHSKFARSLNKLSMERRTSSPVPRFSSVVQGDIAAATRRESKQSPRKLLFGFRNVRLVANASKEFGIIFARECTTVTKDSKGLSCWRSGPTTASLFPAFTHYKTSLKRSLTADGGTTGGGSKRVGSGRAFRYQTSW